MCAHAPTSATSRLAASSIRLFVAIGIAALCAQQSRAADTVFFVVRHAEKVDESDNSPISELGKQRAEQLMQTLQYFNVDGAYHTDRIRTLQTAQPLIAKMQIDTGMVKEYGEASPTWINALLSERKGKRTLIVGHSNTVPAIVGQLSGKTIPSIGNEYDNLFVIVISDDGKSVVRLKFGKSN